MRGNHKVNFIMDGDKEYAIIDTIDPFSKKQNIPITVMREDYENWIQGQFVHTCFPYLNVDQREILISGIGHEEWNKMFNPSENKLRQLYEDMLGSIVDRPPSRPIQHDE